MGIENLINKGKDISQEYKHKHKEGLCFCCNKLFDKDNIKKFRVHGRGYGSLFDTMNFTVQLCPDCLEKIDVNWFNNKLYDELWGYSTRLEKELWNYLNHFRIENQEYIFNTTTEFEDAIDREDWIKINKEEDEDVREELAWRIHKESI